MSEYECPCRHYDEDPDTGNCACGHAQDEHDAWSECLISVEEEGP